MQYGHVRGREPNDSARVVRLSVFQPPSVRSIFRSVGGHFAPFAFPKEQYPALAWHRWSKPTVSPRVLPSRPSTREASGRGRERRRRRGGGGNPPRRGEFRAGRGEFRAGRGEFRAGRGEFRAVRGEFRAGRGEFRAGRGEFRAGRGEVRVGRGEFRAGRGELRAGRRGKGREKEGDREEAGTLTSHHCHTLPMTSWKPLAAGSMLPTACCDPQARLVLTVDPAALKAAPLRLITGSAATLPSCMLPVSRMRWCSASDSSR
eukprot:1189415-Prorocentrum_minimum.AAC.5